MNEELLIRFLFKQCVPDEIRQVREWIEADEKNKEWLFEMERIWSLKDEARFADKDEIEAAYNRFISSQNKKRSNRNGKNLFVQYFKYVAAVLLLGVLSLNLYYLLKPNVFDSTSNTVEVPIGQRVNLTLSDGTKVWLNSKSRFTYPVNFSRETRTVQLEGEGYFEVTKDDKIPFIVEGSSLNVTVLGTKFNMKVYDEEFVVTLKEGKVMVNLEEYGQEVILHPNEKAIRIDERLEVVPIAGDDDIIWKSGVIVFRETPLSEVMKTLSRHYNVEFNLKDSSLKDMGITLKITDEPLDLVLEYIRLATGIDYKIEKSDSEYENSTVYRITL
jgi:ferric-dicitrate binding protein FerR (iron transport regulator)